jgi:hypothetical protein
LDSYLGLSYKNSEADATSLTFSLIDYAWYFRLSDRKAFVRETDSSGITNSNVSDYTAKVFDAFKTYSINRVGTITPPELTKTGFTDSGWLVVFKNAGRFVTFSHAMLLAVPPPDAGIADIKASVNKSNIHFNGLFLVL